MKFLMVAGIGLFSALLTFVMNWLALIPWRRARGKHWSERARVYHPARVSAVSNLWVLPAVASMSVVLSSFDKSPHWAFAALTASVGAIIGTVPMDREVFPRIKPKDLWRHAAINWFIRFLMWFVFLGAAVLMPREFNVEAIVILTLFVVLLLWWNQSGWFTLIRWLGTMTSAPERLSGIVGNTAAKMNVPVSELFLLRTHLAQAYAVPNRRALLFSERLMELMTDEEIAAVTAHELAHLTESRGDYYQRYVIWLMFTPWLLLKPMIHTLGEGGFFLLIATTILAPFIFRRSSHKLEERADAIAHANEPNSGVYARALAKLYEDNLLPAVNAKEHATHPHLYDRLLAAALTPDFPRPKPTATMSLNGVLLAMAVGILAMLLLSRSTDWRLFH